MYSCKCSFDLFFRDVFIDFIEANFSALDIFYLQVLVLEQSTGIYEFIGSLREEKLEGIYEEQVTANVTKISNSCRKEAVKFQKTAICLNIGSFLQLVLGVNFYQSFQ